MRVQRNGIQVTIWTPAKLNLFLEILGKRRDGYHEIETLMVAVSIHDTLYFEPVGSPVIEFRAEWSAGMASGPSGSHLCVALPPAKEDLAYRAINLLRERAKLTQGARVQVIKRIPAAAGLGGASADAAAALVAANIGWGLRWPSERLEALGSELGSDVAFFIRGGTAICRGRGEIVEPSGSFGRIDFVIVSPPYGLSTKRVYQSLSYDHGRATRRCENVKRRGTDGVAAILFNRLTTPAFRLLPKLGQLKEHFEKVDLVGHQLSGSGSSYFGVCRHRRQARRLGSLMNARRLGHAVSVSTTGMQRRVSESVIQN